MGVSVLLSLGLWAPQMWTVRTEMVTVGQSRLSQGARQAAGRAGAMFEGGAGAGKVERALSLRALPFQASCQGHD